VSLAERSARAEETVLLAGGTDWIVERHIAPAASEAAVRPLVVDVSRLGELRGIQVDGETARIGAAATYLEIRRHPVLAARVPLLGAMAREVGAVQIQARGTLGGNLATGSPAADGVTALAALDAEIVLVSARGERTVALSEFYTGYRRTVRAADEVIARVDFRLPAANGVTSWKKVGTRSAQAISKVALAGVAELADGRATRIGLGMASVAPTIAFLPKVRALLASRPAPEVPDAELDAATDADVAPIDDVRSTGAYRRHVARVLVRRFAALLRPGSATNHSA
jgi:CO/xanthine dehydrogenase FAD-binding subunit